MDVNDSKAEKKKRKSILSNKTATNITKFTRNQIFLLLHFL